MLSGFIQIPYNDGVGLGFSGSVPGYGRSDGSKVSFRFFLRMFSIVSYCRTDKASELESDVITRFCKPPCQILKTLSPVMFLNGITAMEISPSEDPEVLAPNILGYISTRTVPRSTMINTSLDLIFLRWGKAVSTEPSRSAMGSVFITPWGVISKIQDRTMATGKPTINRIIGKVTVQSGSPSLGNMISLASITIKAVAV
jgi:hypothetical protein